MTDFMWNTRFTYSKLHNESTAERSSRGVITAAAASAVLLLSCCVHWMTVNAKAFSENGPSSRWMEYNTSPSTPIRVNCGGGWLVEPFRKGWWCWPKEALEISRDFRRDNASGRRLYMSRPPGSKAQCECDVLLFSAC